jgi:hypothetical protein
MRRWIRGSCTSQIGGGNGRMAGVGARSGLGKGGFMTRRGRRRRGRRLLHSHNSQGPGGEGRKKRRRIFICPFLLTFLFYKFFFSPLRSEE